MKLIIDILLGFVAFYVLNIVLMAIVEFIAFIFDDKGDK